MNKYQKLAHNTVLFSIGSIGSKILTFLLVRFYTELLTDVEMSRANIIMQTCFLLLPLATLSLEEAILRFGLDKTKHYNKKQIFTTSLVTMLIWDAVLFWLLLPVLLAVEDTRQHIPALLVYVAASSFHKINQQAIRSSEKVRLFAYDGIQTSILFIAFTVLFMKGFGWGINGFILASPAADIISSCFLMTWGRNSKKIRFKSFNKKLLKEMMKYSLPLIPTAILWWVVSASDLYMVKYMVSEAANGLYSTAYKIPTLITIMGSLFYQAWQMSVVLEMNSADTKRFYTTVYSSFQSLLYVASAGILLLLRPLTNIFTASDYHQIYKMSVLLVLATLFCCLCQFTGAIYTATKQTKHSLYTSLVAALTNVGLNLLLIPKFGVYGAGFSTFASYAICTIIRQIDTRKAIRYTVNTPKMLTNVILLLTMCSAYLVERHFILIALPAFVIICLINFRDVLIIAKRIIKR